MRENCCIQTVPTLGTHRPVLQLLSLPTSFAAAPLGFFHCSFKPHVACPPRTPELSLTRPQPPRQVGPAPAPRSQNSFPLGKPLKLVTHPAAPRGSNGRASPCRRMRWDNLGVRRSRVCTGEQWEVPSPLGPRHILGFSQLRGVPSPWDSARVWRSSCETH